MIKRSALRRLLNNAPSFHSGPSFNLGSIHHDHADLIAEVLQAQGVQFFPVRRPYFADGCKRRGLRVIDTRPRLSSPPTPWPGVTNTITAVKKAQMAQSSVGLIGGAAPTALKGRGTLQDLDPLSLFKSMVKWSEAVRRVKDLAPVIETAFLKAPAGFFLDFDLRRISNRSKKRLENAGRDISEAFSVVGPEGLEPPTNGL